MLFYVAFYFAFNFMIAIFAITLPYNDLVDILSNNNERNEQFLNNIKSMQEHKVISFVVILLFFALFVICSYLISFIQSVVRFVKSKLQKNN